MGVDDFHACLSSGSDAKPCSMQKLLIAMSPSMDPAYNLAMEEFLLASRKESVLFFYRNDPCVVVGKNQNPWRECHPSKLLEQGIQVYRRVSGGGAVYHDPGNLNISISMSRHLYCEPDVFGWWLSALADLGLRASRRGRNAIEVSEKKVSGQAFCYKGSRVLHHGTLLLDANLERLQTVLTEPAIEGELDTHAIESEPAVVMNLGLDLETVCLAFRKNAAAIFESAEEEFTLPELPAAELNRLNSVEWNFGRTPKFTYQGELVQHGLLNGEAFQL